jgi:hypothetical protein
VRAWAARGAETTRAAACVAIANGIGECSSRGGDRRAWMRRRSKCRARQRCRHHLEKIYRLVAESDFWRPAQLSTKMTPIGYAWANSLRAKKSGFLYFQYIRAEQIRGKRRAQCGIAY